MPNMQSLFQEFNLSKFIVYSCLLVFSILLSLRMDGTISISYWIVFTPLWVWKALVVTGAMIGTMVWARNPDYRLSESSYISFKSMLISLSLQLLLLMFELLVCDKLESGRHLWTLAFIPLLFVSLLSVAITVWALKHERPFELELFCAVNVLQFLFIALRLDNLLTWSWVVVFIPFWVIITLAVIGVLYALIFAAILLRTPEIAQDQRRASFNSAISYSLVVMPLLVFLVLLSNKLDQSANPYHQTISMTSHHFSFPHFPASASSSSPSPQTPSFMTHSLSVPNSLTPGFQRPSTHPNHLSSSSSSGSGDRTMPQTHVLPHVPSSVVVPLFSPPPTPQPQPQMSYFMVCCPLFLAFVILICLSFGSRGGNLWWFGMRRDFCSFLLTVCPCLQEYGNISFLPYDKHTPTSPGHELNPSVGVIVNDTSSSTSGSSNNGLTIEDSAEKTSYSLGRSLIVSQPTKKHLSHLHHHVTIESPD